jgi:hypothetical protein
MVHPVQLQPEGMLKQVVFLLVTRQYQLVVELAYPVNLQQRQWGEAGGQAPLQQGLQLVLLEHLVSQLVQPANLEQPLAIQMVVVLVAHLRDKAMQTLALTMIWA